MTIGYQCNEPRNRHQLSSWQKRLERLQIKCQPIFTEIYILIYIYIYMPCDVISPKVLLLGQILRQSGRFQAKILTRLATVQARVAVCQDTTHQIVLSNWRQEYLEIFSEDSEHFSEFPFYTFPCWGHLWVKILLTWSDICPFEWTLQVLA